MPQSRHVAPSIGLLGGSVHRTPNEASKCCDSRSSRRYRSWLGAGLQGLAYEVGSSGSPIISDEVAYSQHRHPVTEKFRQPFLVNLIVLPASRSCLPHSIFTRAYRNLRSVNCARAQHEVMCSGLGYDSANTSIYILIGDVGLISVDRMCGKIDNAVNLLVYRFIESLLMRKSQISIPGTSQ